MEKFKRFIGVYEVNIDGEQHHLAISLRERGMLSSMLGKNNDEALIEMLYSKLVAGWKKHMESTKGEASMAELGEYEDKLGNFLMSHYEDMKIELQVLFGMTTKEELANLEREYKERFLGPAPLEKMEVDGKT